MSDAHSVSENSIIYPHVHLLVNILVHTAASIFYLADNVISLQHFTLKYLAWKPVSWVNFQRTFTSVKEETGDFECKTKNMTKFNPSSADLKHEI